MYCMEPEEVEPRLILAVVTLAKGGQMLLVIDTLLSGRYFIFSDNGGRWN